MQRMFKWVHGYWKFLCAILQLQNTPDPECGLSPAQVLFGRSLKDSFGFTRELQHYTDSGKYCPWQEAWESKGISLIRKYNESSAILKTGSRDVPPLKVGERCLVQNQHGNYPLKWDKSGVVLEVLPHNQYSVKLDGTNRTTNRNRKFLRRLHNPEVTAPPTSMPSSLGETIEDQHGPSASLQPVDDGQPQLYISRRSPAVQPSPHTSSEDVRGSTEPNLPPPSDVRHCPALDTPPDATHRSGQITVPRALSGLLPTNKPGLKEDTDVIILDRLRPRR